MQVTSERATIRPLSWPFDSGTSHRIQENSLHQLFIRKDVSRENHDVSRFGIQTRQWVAFDEMRLAFSAQTKINACDIAATEQAIGRQCQLLEQLLRLRIQSGRNEIPNLPQIVSLGLERVDEIFGAQSGSDLHHSKYTCVWRIPNYTNSDFGARQKFFDKDGTIVPLSQPAASFDGSS